MHVMSRSQHQVHHLYSFIKLKCPLIVRKPYLLFIKWKLEVLYHFLKSRGPLLFPKQLMFSFNSRKAMVDSNILKIRPSSIYKAIYENCRGYMQVTVIRKSLLTHNLSCTNFRLAVSLSRSGQTEWCLCGQLPCQVLTVGILAVILPAVLIIPGENSNEMLFSIDFFFI